MRAFAKMDSREKTAKQVKSVALNNNEFVLMVRVALIVGSSKYSILKVDSLTLR